MSDQSVCTRCGYVGSTEARYCARCGRALIPPRARLGIGTGRWIEDLSPRFVGLAGLIASIPIGSWVHHLFVNVGLHFVLSHLSVALIAGAGGTFVGWRWDRHPSNRSRLVRILLVAMAVGLLLGVVWIVDSGVTDLLVAQGQRIVSDIPGVHVEALGDSRNMLVIRDAPPYSLLMIVVVLLLGVAGNLASRLYTTLMTREREVDDLRQKLLSQVQDSAAQQERNRLARELHDSIKQQLFGVSMSAATVQARWETDPQGAQAALDNLRSVAHEAMVEMNALLQQLSPAPLEKVGLIQALRDQCEALGYRTGAHVTTELGDLPPDDCLPAGTQRSIFRIVQEVFSNIARHARARRVSLTLGSGADENVLVLSIQDDGQGFDPETAKEGMGLDNIRQRVRALGGELIIESGPDQGTQIRASIPLMAPRARKEEIPMDHDHTLSKVVLSGLAGGLALIAVLFYPLYRLLPGSYIAGWEGGSQVIGLLLEIVAVALVVATGFVAARSAGSDSRQKGALFGALAGGASGVLLYLGIVAAAAGLVGQGAMLRHGLVPAAGEGDLVQLAAGAMVGTIGWTHASLWAVLLGGIGLGAVGGLLSPIAAAPSQSDLRSALRMMFVQAAWASALTLMFNILAFLAIDSRIQDLVVNQAISPGTILSPQSVLSWPVNSAVVLYLVFIGTLYVLLRGETDAEDPIRLYGAQATAAFYAAIAVGVGCFLLIAIPTYSSTTLRLSMVGAAAASLVLGGGYVASFIRTRRQRRETGPARRPRAIQMIAAVCVLLNLGMIIWVVGLPSGWGALVGLGIIAVDIVLLAILRRQPRSPSSAAATLAGLQSSVSQMVNAFLGAIVVMIVPVLANVGAGVSLATIAVRFLGILSDYPQSRFLPDLALAQLARDAYLAQGGAAVIVLTAAIAILGLLMLAVSGIMALMRYRVPRED